MTTPKIIDRITGIRDLFADGEIDGGELIEHVDDLLIDIKNGDNDAKAFNNIANLYKEEKNYTS